jgi:hypothetical protein
LACALGCESAGGAASTSGPSDDETSSGSTTTGGGTTFGDAVPCDASVECEPGVCVAPYDPGAGPAAGSGAAGMGMAACVPSCIGEDALDLWCIDDASCCEGLACNAIDGFCSGGPGTSSDSTIGETWVVDSSSEDTASTGPTEGSATSSGSGATSSGSGSETSSSSD